MKITAQQSNEIRKAGGNTERLKYWFDNISDKVTHKEAWQYLGILQLGDSVRYLRKKYGAESIESVKESQRNQFGDKCRFCSYRWLGVEA